MTDYSKVPGTVTWVYSQILPDLLVIHNSKLYDCEKYFKCFNLAYNALTTKTTHIDKHRLCDQYLAELCKCTTSKDIVDLAQKMIFYRGVTKS